MLTAKHWPLFETIFERYTENLLARRFHSVWVRGNTPAGPSPYVIAMQHVSWWDPMVLFFLSRTRFPRGGRHFAMMDERNLRRYRFFRWLGAFGIDRDAREGRSASVRYALEQLAAPNTRVVVFPQGRQYPMDARPLRCRPGTGWIAARARVPIVPIALRYEFLEDEWPELFVSIGEARELAPQSLATTSERAPGDGAKQALDAVEEALTAEADALRDAVTNGRFDSFERLLRGRGERDPRAWERGGYDAVAAAVEGLLPVRPRD